MKNTFAKDTARRLFYDFVKRSFSQDQLSKLHALVLLGKDRLELLHLDALGIPRSSITCVENNQEVYQKLHYWNLAQFKDSKIELCYGDLNHYLHFVQQNNKKIEIFNLDIYGTIQNNLMAEFNKILSLSRNQERTVIGLYTTAGRDANILINSIQATAWLLQFDPSIEKLMSQLTFYFEVAGFKRSTAIGHMLRMMQWLYHIFRALVLNANPNLHKTFELSEIRISFWQKVFENKRNLHWNDFLKAAPVQPEYKYRVASNAKIKLLPEILHFAAYRSGQWTQLCHFMSMHNLSKPISATELFNQLKEQMHRFCFIEAKEGNHFVIKGAKQVPDYKKELIVSNSIYKTLRAKIPVPASQKNIPKRATTVKLTIVPPVLWDGKMLTAAGKELVNQQARQGKNSLQIAEMLPAGVPINSIRAYLAHANRKPALKALNTA